MWLGTKLFVVGGITVLVLLNPVSAAARQNPAPAKTIPHAASPSAPSQPQETSPSVLPSQPVITVRGVCGQNQQKNAGDSLCETVVTREEFDTLMRALNANGQSIPPGARKGLAKTYADYLAVEAAARKTGIEDTPEFRELMNWTRLLTISELYRRSIQNKYSAPSRDEIDGYYKQHSEEFERVKLSRVLVPRVNPASASKEETDKRALQAAGSARDKLLSGAAPAQAEKDAYAELGLSAPPPTDLGNRRRTDLIPGEVGDVFSLQAGGVSRVEAEPGNYVIYRVESREVVPEQDVRNDISREIYRRKFREAMQSVLDAAPAHFDEQYFSAPVQPTPANPQ